MAKNQLFFVVFGTANLSLLLYGLLALAMPGILFESFSQHVYQFPNEAGIAVGYLLALFRLLGFFNLLLGLTVLFLLWRFWVDAQPWMADLVMCISFLAYLAPLVFDHTVGEIGFLEILEHVLFVAMVVTAVYWRRR